MFKNSKLILRVMLATILVVASALTCVGVVSLAKKSKTSYTNTESVVGEPLTDYFAVRVGESSNNSSAPSVSAAEGNGPIEDYSDEDVKYTYSTVWLYENGGVTKAPDKISYGCKITFSNSDAYSAKVVFEDKDSSNKVIKGTAAITIELGYEFTGFEAGYYDGSGVFQNMTGNNLKLDTDNNVTTINKTYTASQLDPKYSGKIIIRVLTKVGVYETQCAYENLLGSTYPIKQEYGYSTASEFPKNEDIPWNINRGSQELAISKELDFWYFAGSSGNYQGNGVTYSINVKGVLKEIEIKCDKKPGAKVYIAYSFEDGYYKITSIKGSMDFLPNDYLIRAKSKNTYVATFSAGRSAVWTDPLRDGNLFGVTSNQGGITSNDGKSNFSARTSYRLFDTGSRAFYKKDEMTPSTDGTIDAENSHALFNYGYYISGYTIDIAGEGGSRASAAQYSSENDARVEMPSIPSSATPGYNLQSLAEELDKAMANNTYKYLQRITITPISWVPATIQPYLSNTDTKLSDIAITFNKPYTISGVGDTLDQTLVGFEYPSNTSRLIATGGLPWNYVIDEGCFESISNTSYKIELTPYYVDNIFKVPLQNIIPNNAESYWLNSQKTIVDGASYRDEYDITNFDSYDLGYKGGRADYHAEKLKDNVEGYEASIKDDVKDRNDGGGCLSIFNYIYSSSGDMWIYVANNQELYNLPVFETEYSTTVIWKYQTSANTLAWKTSAYNTNYMTDADDYKDGNTRWYSAKDMTLSAHHAFMVDMYYNPYAGSENRYTYESIKSGYFGLNYSTAFSDKNTDVSNESEMGAEVNGWIFDAEQANKESYTVTYDSTTKVLTANKYGVNWTFAVEKIDEYNENYYFVSRIQGYGVFTQAYKNNVSGNKPILIVDWSYANAAFDLTIDNSSTYWKDMDFSDLNSSSLIYGGVASSAVSGSMGYYSSVDTSLNRQTTLKFMSSYEKRAGLSFKTYDDFKGKNYSQIYESERYKFDYAVYNYGHYITGWKAKVNFTDGGIKYVNYTYSAGAHNVSFVDSDSTIIGLDSNKTFGKLIEKVADYYGYLMRSEGNYDTRITLTPIWGKVSVEFVVDNVPLDSDVLFGDGYNVVDTATSTGQSLFGYSFVSDDALVSKDGKWSYISGKNSYERVDDSNYKVKLNRIYLNNIYKISLNNVYLTNKEAKTLVISNDDYNFSNSDISAILFTYEDIVDSYSFETYYNYVTTNSINTSTFIMDNYIQNSFGAKKTQWESAISDKTFSILKEIYHSSGISNGTTLTCENVSNWYVEDMLWIYLAHNSKPGNLPIFTNEYSTTMAWQSADYQCFPTDNEQDVKDIFDAASLKDSNKWVFASVGKARLNALSVYRAKYYYEGVNTTNENPNYDFVLGDWYLNPSMIVTLEDLSVEEGYLKPNKSVFESWLFDYEVAKTTFPEKVNKSEQGGNTTFTIVHDDAHETIIKTRGGLTGDRFYFIVDITGNEIFEQSAISPIIRAKLATTYVATINSNASYWNDRNVESAYGAYSYYYNTNNKQFVENSGDSVNLLVTNTSDFAYPFAHSYWGGDSRVFYKNEDWASMEYLPNSRMGHYYVYNYGHYITHWEIALVVNEEPISYVTILNGDLVNGDLKSAVAIEDLSGIYFRQIAALIDILNIEKFGNEYSVSLTPTWGKTHINVEYNTNSIGNFDFDSDYALSKTTAPIGQSLMAYAYNTQSDETINDSLISIDGLWNYANIAYEYFVDDETAYAAGTHTIRVEPVFVNNIYKVNLSDIYLDKLYNESLGCATLTLKNSGYVYNDATLSTVVVNYETIGASDYDFITYGEFKAGEESYVLMDNYISQLITNKLNWESGIINLSFSMFGQLYFQNATKDSDAVLHLDVESNNDKWYANEAVSGFGMWIYLAHNQDMTQIDLPAFEGEYAATMAWKDEIKTRYYVAQGAVNEIEQIETIYTAQQNDNWYDNWLYNANENCSLSHVSAYRTKYYYEGANTTDDNPLYEYVVGDWYRSPTTITLTSLETYDNLNLKPEKSVFDGWLFNLENAKTQFGESNVRVNGAQYIITHGNGSTIINTNGYLSYSNSLFRVVNMTGDEIFEQSAILPIIVAKFNGIYNTTIDNSAIYWNGKLDDYSVAGAVSKYVNMHNEPINETDYEVSLEVANSIHHAYPFMSSIVNGASSVFYHASDFDIQNVPNGSQTKECYYYVYNYGHCITGWKIIIIDKGTKEQAYLTILSGDFKVSDAETTIGISNLINKNLTNVAVVVDDMNAVRFGVGYEIKLIPVWESVEVSVQQNRNELGRFDFASTYELDKSKTTVPIGQSLMAYTTEQGGLVSVDGIWNYANIGYGEYVASTLSNYGNATYAIQVIPAFVNNIYKVNLTNVYLTDVTLGALTLDGNKTSYRFNSESISDLGYTYTDSISYKDNADNYTFINYSTYYSSLDETEQSQFLMDSYIENILRVSKTDWENAIVNQNFMMFGWVYFGVGQKSGDTSLSLSVDANNTEWRASEAVSGFGLWIYLANEQSSADLPVFKNDYASNMAWQTTSEYHATKEVEGSERLQDIKASIETRQPNNWVDIWEYSNGDNLSAVYAYRTKYYYEGQSTEANGVYEYIWGDWYHQDDATILYSIDEDGENIYAQQPDESKLREDKNIFNGWILDLSVAQNIFGTDNVTKTSNVIRIKHATGKTTLITVSGSVRYSENKLWYIQQISGGEILEHSSTAPIIRAKLGSIYNVEINNESVYWNGLIDDYTVAGVVTNYVKKGENAPTASMGYKANLEVANTKKYEYGFMSSVLNYRSSVFYHEEDYGANLDYVPSADNGYYYVYNYGHYLSGWKIYLIDVNKYLVIQNGEWNAISATSGTQSQFIISTNTLTSVNFANFAEAAEQADNAYVNKFGTMRIVLYPQWVAASIQVKCNKKSLFNSSVSFGIESYTLNSVSVGTGASLMAYAYNQDDVDNSLISIKGRWNYAQIPYENYMHDENAAIASYGNVLYTLGVVPIAVDNVYTVELRGASKNLRGVYELTEGYIFNSARGLYDGDSGAKYFTYENSFESNVGQYSFEQYNNQVLIDDYIVNLRNMKITYINGINGDGENDFNLFKKVFFTSADYTLDMVNFATLANEDANNLFYVYLANNQECGFMPVFSNAYNTLIFWENAEFERGTLDKYAYITNEIFEADDYIEELAEFKTHNELDDSIKKIWCFTDGDNSVGEALVAHYFRKNYILDIKTTLSQQVSRSGYVLLEIFDTLHDIDNSVEDRGGKYLAIAEQGIMEIYQLALGNIDAFALKDMSAYATKVVPSGRLINGQVKLYAGCDVSISIRDQSKDSESMATGNFDEMIGYKYKTLTQSLNPEQSTSNLFNEMQDETTGYKYYSESEVWIEYDYKNQTVIELNVEFENILYDLIIKMQDANMGLVSYAKDGEFVAARTIHNLTGLKAGNDLRVGFSAYAGFTLGNEAFVWNYSITQNCVLQTFNDAEQADGEGGGQTHALTLNGTWLREKLYSQYLPNYTLYPNGANNNTNLGELIVQGEAITFSYGFITRDYVDYENPETRVINFENRVELGDLKLTKNSTGYSAKTITFNSYIKESSRFNSSTYWLMLGDDYYSLWQSELYYYSASNANQYTTEYSFPLMAATPSVQHEIGQNQIAAMVEGYREGIIIANNNRNLNLLLDISLYVEQSMHIEADFCNENADSLTMEEKLQDPNRGYRLVEINYKHNDKDETIQILVSANAQFNSLGHFELNYSNAIKNWTKLEDNILYYPAYIGMMTGITTSTKYDDYSSVDVYSGDMNGDEIITLAKCAPEISEKGNNGFEYVRFNAKPLHANYIYKHIDENGTTSVMSLEEISEYITETEAYKTSPDRELYIDKSCNAMTYEVKVKDAKYVVEVVISGGTKGKATNISLVGQSAHIITVTDYAAAQGEFVNIEVIVGLNDASNIDIVPMIADSQTALGLGDFGSYSITTTNVIDGDEQTKQYNNLTEAQQLNLVEGEKVEITFNLNEGYRFVGYKYGNVTQTSAAENSKVVIISSFDVKYHMDHEVKQYFLIIEKIPINVQLDTSNSAATYRINSNVNNAVVYINQGVVLSQTGSPQTERLMYFYYYNLDNEKVPLLGAQAQAEDLSTEFELTKEMVECCIVSGNARTLTIYVEIVARVKLTLTLTGAQYLVGGNVIFTGADGSSISIPSVEKDKNIVYTMYFDKTTELQLSANTLIEGKYEITFNNNTPNYILNETITMNQDEDVLVEVAPKVFGVEVNEFVYTNLTDLANKTPQQVPEGDMVNAINASGQHYDADARLEFMADIENNRRLTTIVISGNDMEPDVEIDITNVDFNSKILVDDYTLIFERLAGGGYRAVLSYITKADIALTLIYTEYKTISA